MPNQYFPEQIPQDLARHALLSQSACNVSGLIHFLPEIVSQLWDIAKREGKGTDWVNQHPVLVLFATQISWLTGAEIEGRWKQAVKLCEQAGHSQLADLWPPGREAERSES